MQKESIGSSGEYFSCHRGNRFRLVILASQRAHELSSGACTAVERNGDKNTVVALREISSGKLNLSAVFGLAVQRCKKYLEEFTNSREIAAHVSKTAQTKGSWIGSELGKNFRSESASSAFLDQKKFLSTDTDKGEGF